MRKINFDKKTLEYTQIIDLDEVKNITKSFGV